MLNKICEWLFPYKNGNFYDFFDIALTNGRVFRILDA